MPNVDLPGVHLWYTDTGGSGVPVVFMHAASGTSDSWVHQVPAFGERGYRCVAYDRRGWGRSQPDSTGEQPGRGSDDLRALVDHLAMDKFHLVATAAGAAVAMDYALSYPENLRSLAIADCTGGLSTDPEYAQLRKLARPPEFEALPIVLREVGPSYRATNPEGTRRWMEIAEASNHESAARQRPRNEITLDLVATLKVPVLALVGAADMSTPPALMRMLVSRIPNCEYHTVLDAGHAAFWEEPETWNRLVLDFIERH
jgi:pimeloyl-ACP methyl ester carboxylesterase